MRDLSVTEHAVLGILAEGPSHGFAVSKQLARDSDLGRILTVRRPLVYRALDRLVDRGLAEPVHTEKGSGPSRVVHRVTGDGRRESRNWLARPVDHVRDIRIEFLLKVALMIRARRSLGPLIAAQRRSLEPTLSAIAEVSSNDYVEIWRKHVAGAAGAFLDELDDVYR